MCLTAQENRKKPHLNWNSETNFYGASTVADSGSELLRNPRFTGWLVYRKYRTVMVIFLRQACNGDNGGTVALAGEPPITISYPCNNTSSLLIFTVYCHHTKWHLGITVIQQAKSTTIQGWCSSCFCVACPLSPFSPTSTFIIILH